jgi:hypothetical protein
MICFSFLLAWPLILSSQVPDETESALLTFELKRWSDNEVPVGATVTAHWGIKYIHVNDAFGGRVGSMVRGVVADDGLCELTVPAGEILLVYIRGGEDTRLTRVYVDKPLLKGERRLIETVVYPRGIPVKGVVVDDHGRPVAGARVTATWGSQDWASHSGSTLAQGLVGLDAPPDLVCRSNDQGNFVFDGLDGPEFLRGSKADWILSASTESMKPFDRVQVNPRDAGAEVSGIKLRMAPVRDLKGKVIGPDGKPVAGVAVSVRDFGPGSWSGTGIQGAFFISPADIDPPIISGNDGNFLISDLVEGAWTLGVYLEGQPSATVKIGRQDLTATISFVREIGDALIAFEGTVVDEGGDPIEGAKVLYARWTRQMVETDAKGRFLMPGIEPDKLGFGMTFYAPGYALNGLMIERSRNGVPPIPMVLSPEKTVVGRVVGPDGRPRQGLQVLVSAVEPEGVEYPYWKKNGPHYGFDLSEDFTDGDGGFEFKGLWKGDWHIRVRDETLVHSRLLAAQTVNAGTQDLVIKIGGKVVRNGREIQVLGDGMASFEGRLVDSVTLEPIHGFSVHPGKHSGSSSNYQSALKQWIDNENGSFRFNSLAQGSWSFVFEAEGYVREDSRWLKLPHDGGPVVFLLGPKVDLDLRIQDSLGKPVHLAILDARGLNGDRLATQSIEPLGGTDQGGATLEGLPKGKIVILVSPPGSFVEFEFPVDLREDHSDGLDLTLPADFSSPRQAFEVKVRNADGGAVGRSFALYAKDMDGVVVASWRVSFWRDTYSVIPGHDLMGFFKKLPQTLDSVVPFELPPGRFRLSLSGDGWEQQGPEVVVQAAQTPEGVTIVVDSIGD